MSSFLRFSWLFLLLPFFLPAYARGQSTFYVDVDAPPDGSGSSWETAFNDLQDALAEAAGSGGTVTEIRVAEGTYKPAGAQGQAIWYVDDDAPLGGDGTSWATAYTYLQDALAVAIDGDELHVAGGAYEPDRDDANPEGTGDRTATFQLISGVGMYGGYAGFANPANPDERDIEAYETILTGDLNGDDGPDFENNAENVYHVVVASGTDEAAVLDGFTISGGNADGPADNGLDAGGGIYDFDGSPRLANCTVAWNSASGYEPRGGGMYIATGAPTLTHCTFVGNRVYASYKAYGGGMYNSGDDITLTNCAFRTNSALGYDRTEGGGMYNSGDYPLLTNCTFEGNLADSSNDSANGGGMENRNGSPTLIDCTFTANTVSAAGLAFGGGIHSVGDPTFRNCTFSENLILSGDISYNSGGGGMASDGSPILTDCTFTANTVNAAGVAAGGGMLSHGDPTLRNCTFNENLLPGALNIEHL